MIWRSIFIKVQFRIKSLSRQWYGAMKEHEPGIVKIYDAMCRH